MLTKRAFLLTLTGLCIGYLAAGQSSAPAAGPTPTDVLLWAGYAIGVVVLLLALVTGASLALSGARQLAAAEPAAEYQPQSATRPATQPERAAPQPLLATDATVLA